MGRAAGSGQPVSVHPLYARALPYTGTDGLQAPRTGPGCGAGDVKGKGQAVKAAGVRLPGWTGGAGFFLDDGARLPARGRPALASARRLRGRPSR